MAGKSKENELTYYMRVIVRSKMKAEGRNFKKCELCGDPISEGKYQLHHTKYDGARYADIKIVCVKCNQKKENKLLD